jgi:hypothetical protein
MLRKEVLELARLGILPNNRAGEALVSKYEILLASITPPITNDEARVLVKLFGTDDGFGLAWTLLHLVESAPDWPIKECLEGENKWVKLLCVRSGD